MSTSSPVSTSGTLPSSSPSSGLKGQQTHHGHPGNQPDMAHFLAEYALNLKYEDLPQDVVAETKRRVIDSIGCAYGAMRSGPASIGRNLAKLAAPAGGHRGATPIGTNQPTTLDYATFANGVLFRYLDFNDTYLSKEPAHPSDNIAAVLAVGEALKSSGKEIITAIVLAYEIQCRLCDAASIRAKGWDHVTYGAISSAVAVGKLYGLTLQQMVYAIGLATIPNVAMRQTRVGELSNWKGCAFANAARNGVFAATLAHLGMSGPAPAFEGEMGFWNQVSRDVFTLAPFGGMPIEPAGDGSRHRFMMTDTYVKHYPAEYHAQSAIEAVLELREQLDSNTSVDEQVTNIHIDSFDAAIDIIAGFKEHWKPTNRETADHSMPYMVAAALLDGDLTLASFTQERIHDPRLVAFIQKVTVARHPEMNAGYPDGIPNRLTLTLADGKQLVKQIAYPLGHNKNPMKNEDIERKFKGLTQGVIEPSQEEKILSLCWQLETLDDVRPLILACDMGL